MDYYGMRCLGCAILRNALDEAKREYRKINLYYKNKATVYEAIRAINKIHDIENFIISDHYKIVCFNIAPNWGLKMLKEIKTNAENKIKRYNKISKVTTKNRQV